MNLTTKERIDIGVRSRLDALFFARDGVKVVSAWKCSECGMETESRNVPTACNSCGETSAGFVPVERLGQNGCCGGKQERECVGVGVRYGVGRSPRNDEGDYSVGGQEIRDSEKRGDRQDRDGVSASLRVNGAGGSELRPQGGSGDSRQGVLGHSASDEPRADGRGVESKSGSHRTVYAVMFARLNRVGDFVPCGISLFPTAEAAVEGARIGFRGLVYVQECYLP